MSHEGFTQYICKNGHYWNVDCNIDNGWEYEKCSECNESVAWWNMVDVTNGSYDGDKRIDGYVEVELKELPKCKKCGSNEGMIRGVFDIPKTVGYLVGAISSKLETDKIAEETFDYINNNVSLGLWKITLDYLKKQGYELKKTDERSKEELDMNQFCLKLFHDNFNFDNEFSFRHDGNGIIYIYAEKKKSGEQLKKELEAEYPDRTFVLKIIGKVELAQEIKKIRLETDEICVLLEKNYNCSENGIEFGTMLDKIYIYCNDAEKALYLKKKAIEEYPDVEFLIKER